MAAVQDLYGDQLPTFTRLASSSQSALQNSAASLLAQAAQSHDQDELKLLQNYPHYFPTFSRDDAMFHLKNTRKGTFLIRPSSQAGSLVISLAQSAKILHLLIIRRGSGWGVDPSAWKTHELCTETYPHVEQLLARLKQFNMLEYGLTHQDVARNLSAAVAPSLQRLLSLNSQSTALESEYKGMLSVFLSEDKMKIHPREAHMLQQWRTKNAFTHQQHVKVLASLGVSEPEFEQLIDNDDTPSGQDSNICVVCMNNSRQAAFVPCGHVATCCDCAQMLNDCPLCRKAITKVLKVFIT